MRLTVLSQEPVSNRFISGENLQHLTHVTDDEIKPITRMEFSKVFEYRVIRIRGVIYMIHMNAYQLQ